MSELSDESARVLLQLCDSVPLRGAAAKLAVGKAQAELEAALRESVVNAQRDRADGAAADGGGAPADLPAVTDD